MAENDSPTRPSDSLTIYPARAVVTMDPAAPRAEAVAVEAGRIVAVGSVAELTELLADRDPVVDTTLADQFVLPGFLEQHLHPILGASTLVTEVISTDAWEMPTRTFEAAANAEEYWARLSAGEAAMDDPEEWLFSWGYHELWHGPMTRQMLDEVSSTRPVGIWQRSCHEFYLNTAAIDRLGLTAENMAGHGPGSEMLNLDKGHFWESGFMTVLLPHLAPVFLTVERLSAGLVQMVDYLHANGVTACNEPGILWDAEPFKLYQQILGADDVPMSTTFLVDGRSQAESGLAPEKAVADAERQVQIAPEGKVSIVADQIKLFADGAIISQLMQMTDPYLDRDGNPDPAHTGEWLMEPEILEQYARAYWDAGWQIHTHVNGDEGLEVLLGILERCNEANPRPDHRSVIVHFANSTEEQIQRIAKLGAIVSANPYYPCGFADKYAEVGLGPDRADNMVRAQSVLDAGISYSVHSDLPMGPADPLKLAWCAVNRITQSGRVAAPDQRISVDAAMRAITIDAAYSWQREHDLGSIEVGKIANFTVLADDPYDIDPTRLDKVPVTGTVFEGRWFPVPERAGAAASSDSAKRSLSSLPGLAPPLGGHSDHDCGGCSCRAARALYAAVAKQLAA